MKEPRRQLRLLIAIALTVLVLDLVTKEFATFLLASGTAAALPEEGLFRFFLTHNEGAAGGIWLGDTTRIINILSMSLVVAIAAMIARSLIDVHKLAPAALGLVIGGALGNTASLLMGPGVVDFIAFDVGASEIVFNVADIAALAGIAAMAPIALAIVTRIRSTIEERATLPQTVSFQTRAADVVRKTTVFEREVPLAFASEIARPASADDTLSVPKPARRTIVTDQRPTDNTDLRAQ